MGGVVATGAKHEHPRRPRRWSTRAPKCCPGTRRRDIPRIPLGGGEIDWGVWAESLGRPGGMSRDLGNGVRMRRWPLGRALVKASLWSTERSGWHRRAPGCRPCSPLPRSAGRVGEDASPRQALAPRQGLGVHPGLARCPFWWLSPASLSRTLAHSMGATSPLLGPIYGTPVSPSHSMLHSPGAHVRPKHGFDPRWGHRPWARGIRGGWCEAWASPRSSRPGA